MEITTRSLNEPNTSVENEGKLCKEEDSCKPSSEPTDLFHEELHVDTSYNTEKISSDDASNNNDHNRICEAAPTPSRKRSVFIRFCVNFIRYFLFLFWNYISLSNTASSKRKLHSCFVAHDVESYLIA